MKKLIDTMKNYGFSNEVICGVLGNIKAECNFQLKSENMYYTKVETLKKVFPSKFKVMTDEEIEKYTKNPSVLGDLVYSSLGGYKYRGRGYIQITGITNYKTYSEILKLDLVNNPDFVLREDIACLIVAEYIKNVAFRKYPSLNNIKEINVVSDIITKSIQGFNKNYSTGFLKEHLELKRKYSNEFYNELKNWKNYV